MLIDSWYFCEGFVENMKSRLTDMKLLSYKQCSGFRLLSEKTVEIWKLGEIGLLGITEYRKIKEN